MTTQAAAAAELLSLIVAEGARPGRSLSVSVPGSIGAGAAFTTSTTAIEMSAPNPGWVTRGMSVYDASTCEPIGTVWSWPQGSSTLTLQAPAANASGSSADTLVFANAGDLNFTRFPGALQAAFLAAGYQLGDLVGALSYAVAEGWLVPGDKFDRERSYSLQWAGFTAASGSVPTMAASGQQAINAMVNAGAAAGSPVSMNLLVKYFVGTVGGNTFAPEDLLPGFAYAMTEGWVFLTGQKYDGPVFALTAAGVAQAA